MFFSRSGLTATLVLCSSLALGGCVVDVDAGGTGGTGGSGGGQGGSGAQAGSGGGQGGIGAQAGSGGGQGGIGGNAGCDDHDDCAGTDLCVFETGQCGQACGGENASCPDGQICDECATGSCPGCEDCVAVCVPAPTGCQTHDDCPGENALCIFSTGECSTSCTPGTVSCAPGLTCDGCATGSCGDCDDCVAACVPDPSGPCTTHQDCDGGLCLFESGVCTSKCSENEPCGAGEVCSDCAAGSCPLCLDCLAGCVPAQPGQCDSADDCPAGSVCRWETNQCEVGCINGNDCADPNSVCIECATSSCPACADCVGICLPPP